MTAAVEWFFDNLEGTAASGSKDATVSAQRLPVAVEFPCAGVAERHTQVT